MQEPVCTILHFRAIISEALALALLPPPSNFPSSRYLELVIQYSAFKMPQNEYIERWQKQYGKRCVFNVLTVSSNFLVSNITHSVSTMTSANASASPAKLTKPLKIRRIFAAYGLSCTSKNVTRRKSR